MSLQENYRDQEFETAQDAALYSSPEMLLQTTEGNDHSVDILRAGTPVSVRDVHICAQGKRHRYLARAEINLASSRRVGWMCSSSLSGGFVNVTLGLIEPAGDADAYSSTAVWEDGRFLGQHKLIRIVDRRGRLKTMSVDMAGPYFRMVEHASADGIAITINSAFRSYPDQKFYHDQWVAKTPGFFRALPPGQSRHQNGTAIDIPVGEGPGTPVYDWLAQNATGHGFVRTEPTELWHWEHRPSEATKAQARGVHTIWD